MIKCSVEIVPDESGRPFVGGRGSFRASLVLMSRACAAYSSALPCVRAASLFPTCKGKDLSPVRLLCLALFCLLLPQAVFAESDEPKEDSFVVRKNYGGMVRRDMAMRAVKIAAEAEAVDRGLRLLGREKAFSVAPAQQAGKAQPGAEERRIFVGSDLPLDGLARMLFPIGFLRITREGQPPSDRVAAHVRLTIPVDLSESLQKNLNRRDLMEINSRLLYERRRLLTEYDALAEKLLNLDASSEGGKEMAHGLQRICNEMEALEIFAEVLSSLGPQWASPDTARSELEKAHRLAPENALVQVALAETLLQLDRPMAALEHAGDAVKHAPDYARAFDAKGAVQLRQRLPGLAADAFSRAIELSPANSAYRMHRGSAYLLLNNEKGMCEDFDKACNLGDCGGIDWARKMGKCAEER